MCIRDRYTTVRAQLTTAQWTKCVVLKEINKKRGKLRVVKTTNAYGTDVLNQTFALKIRAPCGLQ